MNGVGRMSHHDLKERSDYFRTKNLKESAYVPQTIQKIRPTFYVSTENGETDCVETEIEEENYITKYEKNNFASIFCLKKLGYHSSFSELLLPPYRYFDHRATSLHIIFQVFRI